MALSLKSKKKTSNFNIDTIDVTLQFNMFRKKKV
jgi:hypothetical protein